MAKTIAEQIFGDLMFTYAPATIAEACKTFPHKWEGIIINKLIFEDNSWIETYGDEIVRSSFYNEDKNDVSEDSFKGYFKSFENH